MSVPAAYGRRHLGALLARIRSRHPRLTIEIELSDRHVDLIAPVMTRDLYAVYPSRTHLAPKVACFVRAVQEQTDELFPIDG